MRREVIAVGAERTHPEFATKVDLAVGIQDGAAGYGGTADWFVGECGGS